MADNVNPAVPPAPPAVPPPEAIPEDVRRVMEAIKGGPATARAVANLEQRVETLEKVVGVQHNRIAVLEALAEDVKKMSPGGRSESFKKR